MKCLHSLEGEVLIPQKKSPARRERELIPFLRGHEVAPEATYPVGLPHSE